MRFLLDTNIVSEWVKPTPDQGVLKFLEAVDEESLYLSAITIAEIRYGIERMAEGRRRQTLTSWLSVDLAERFDGKILSVDKLVADRWGKIMAESQTFGRTLSSMDAFLAATALVHNTTLVTRNEVDFQVPNLTIANPWSRQSPGVAH